ncbi:unnamed protein product [Closterium sp. NIES-53]
MSPRVACSASSLACAAVHSLRRGSAECYFLIVVDDYFRYTTVLPQQQKADVPTVLEPWLLVRGDVQTLYGLCLHSDRGVLQPGYLPVLQFPGRHFQQISHLLKESPSQRFRDLLPPLFLTTEPPPVAPIAPAPSRPAPSSVSHVTPPRSVQSLPCMGSLPWSTRQPGTNVVSGMWLYKVKRPPGSPPVFKARYVARGFRQREGVEFLQTFAPTLKMATLQGSMHEQIWLRRSPGFTGSFPLGTQWQLRGPVYGLRQAPREWHGTPRTILAALDFFPSSADASLFVRRGSTPFFVLIYVDNLVFATPDRQALASVKEEMQRRHTCTDLGELQRYLGRQITRERAARIITLM